jgi:sulfur relay protein TusB/DsrH
MDETENTLDIGFVITKAPLESTLPYGFLTIAQHAVDTGKRISIFLLSDGIWLVKKNQKSTVFDLLQNLIKQGVSVIVSKDHLEAAGLNDSDIIPGVTVVEKPYAQLVDDVMEKWQRVIVL